MRGAKQDTRLAFAPEVDPDNPGGAAALAAFALAVQILTQYALTVSATPSL
jgi:hypothetical protein